MLFHFNKLLYVANGLKLSNSSQEYYRCNATSYSYAWVDLGSIIWHSCFTLNRESMSEAKESCSVNDITLEMLYQFSEIKIIVQQSPR